MSLQRKARRTGDSLSVGIPSHVAELHSIDEGTVLEFQPMEKGVFKIIALAKVCKVRNKETGKTENIKAQNGKCIVPKGYEIA